MLYAVVFTKEIVGIEIIKPMETENIENEKQKIEHEYSPEKYNSYILDLK